MKTYIVTGGASGIGLAIVQSFLGAGAQVGVIDPKELPPELDEAREKQKLIYVQGSSGEEAKVRELVRRVKQQWGQLNGLVNNSGIMIRKPITELSLEEWQKVLETNLTSAFLCARESIPLLKASKGAIVSIASTRAHQSEPNTESYAASKGGLYALNHALAISLGPEIRSNLISPGWIDSRSQVEKQKEPLKPADHDQHPVGRVGQPEDIVKAVHYLLSEESSFMTGQELIIDGGMTRKMIYEE